MGLHMCVSHMNVSFVFKSGGVLYLNPMVVFVVYVSSVLVVLFMCLVFCACCSGVSLADVSALTLSSVFYCGLE